MKAIPPQHRSRNVAHAALNFVALAYLLLASVPGAASAPTAGVTLPFSLPYAGVARKYLLHVPPAYGASRKFPLLLVFHPMDGTGAGIENTSGLDGIADAHDFLVAYPDSNPQYGNGKDWQTTGAGNDVNFSLEMLLDIESRYSIDPASVYLSGYSKGGGMVEQLACQDAATFAGAAIVSENMNPQMEAGCQPARPVKFVFFHGTADPISPYNGGPSGLSGGPTYSALETAQFWAAVNGCRENGPQEKIADVLSTGEPVTDTLQAWMRCRNAATVALYTIQGGGHTWPGGNQRPNAIGPDSIPLGAISRDLNASLLLWQYLILSGTTLPPVSLNTIFRKYDPGTGWHEMTLAPGAGPRTFYLEGVGFQLYSAPDYSNSRELYKCRWSNGYFVSPDPGCEGQITVSSLGWAHATQTGAEVPIYRFYAPWNGDHLITINPAEGYDNHYVLDEILGYGLP